MFGTRCLRQVWRKPLLTLPRQTAVMYRYTRPRRDGVPVFLTIALAARGADLLARQIETLRQAVRLTRAERPFAINAWVVLPDHMHCIWTLPDGDTDYSTRVAALKARFTIAVGRSGFTPTLATNPYGVRAGRDRSATAHRVGVNPDLRKDEAPVWQKRFWEHHLRDEADYRAHLRYCWVNPVKHGLVPHPRDWPFSTWHRDGSDDLLL